MKKLSFFGLALLAVMTSCNLSQAVTTYLPAVELNKQKTITPANSIGKESSLESVEDQGDRLALVAQGEVSGDKIAIHPAESPYVPSKIENPALEIEYNNPGTAGVKVDGAKVKVDGKEYDVPAIDVPAGGSAKLVLTNDPEAPAHYKDATVKPLPGDLGVKLETKQDGDIVVDGFKVTKAESIEVSAYLYIPLVFKKGEQIKIVKTFTDMGIDVKDFGITVSEYQLEAKVSSTFPFQIDAAAASATEKASAKLSNPILPGKVGAPVITEVTADIESKADISTLNNATVLLILTATEGAKIEKGQTLEVDYKTIKLKKL